MFHHWGTKIQEFKFQLPLSFSSQLLASRFSSVPCLMEHPFTFYIWHKTISFSTSLYLQLWGFLLGPVNYIGDKCQVKNKIELFYFPKCQIINHFFLYFLNKKNKNFGLFVDFFFLKRHSVFFILYSLYPLCFGYLRWNLYISTTGNGEATYSFWPLCCNLIELELNMFYFTKKHFSIS